MNIRWLYDYDFKDNNSWSSRDESGWACPSKLCDAALTIDEVIQSARQQLLIGRDRDWSFKNISLD